MDPNTEHSVKVQCLKELHSLSKTYTLIVKDLPFVTLLTKYYDGNLFISNYNSREKVDAKEIQSNKEYQKLDNNLVDNKNHYYRLENSNKIHFDNFKSEKATEIMDNNALSNTNKNPDQYKDIDEEMMEEIANQTHKMDFLKGKKYEEITQEDWDKIETPQFKESIRKVKELLDE